MWVVEYLRYASEGRYEAETLTEAIAVAMGYIEEGWASPGLIRRPSGEVVVDKAALSEMYAKDWGRLTTEQIADALDEALA